MKLQRLFPLSVLLGLLLALVLPASVSAQDDQTITLNDATPSLVVAVNLPADTTGVVSINFSLAMITMRNEAGEAIFRAADPRLHTVELSIAANTGAHTLTIERLPGTSQAYVSLLSLPELSATAPASTSVQPQFVDNNQVSLNQERALPLSSATPGGVVGISVPAETSGLITTTFPGTKMMTQLVDLNGIVLAGSLGDVDGFNFVVDSGEYQMKLLASNLTSDMVAGVRVTSAEANGFIAMQPPTDVTVADTQTQTVEACTATILTSSVNLRSGPGTGYSVLGYGYHNQTLTVGGVNTQQNWVLVGTDNGSNNSFSGWVSRDLTQLNGACDRLTVYDIPLRQAKPAQIIIQTIEQPGSASAPDNNNNGGSTGGGENEHEDHEDHDDD